MAQKIDRHPCFLLFRICNLRLFISFLWTVMWVSLFTLFHISQTLFPVTWLCGPWWTPTSVLEVTRGKKVWDKTGSFRIDTRGSGSEWCGIQLSTQIWEAELVGSVIPSQSWTETSSAELTHTGLPVASWVSVALTQDLGASFCLANLSVIYFFCGPSNYFPKPSIFQVGSVYHSGITHRSNISLRDRGFEF